MPFFAPLPSLPTRKASAEPGEASQRYQYHAMVLAALSMGFSLSDMESLTLNDLLIYTAIHAENRSAKKVKTYRPATQKDIEALKRM